MKRNIVDGEKTMALERLRIKMKKIRNIDYSDTIPDDLLHEILIRLPNLKSSIRCSAVSKRWSSVTYRPDFFPTFLYHYQSNTPPLTLIIGDGFISRNPIRISLRPRPPSSSLPVVSGIAGMLDSFPWLSNLFVSNATLVATCDDLFLIKSCGYYYVYNPITGQKTMLTAPPIVAAQSFSLHLARCGLVCDPNNYKYRVMLLFQPENMNNNNNNSITTSYITVFCSETEEWTELRNHTILLSSVNCDVVASNGNLYWLGPNGIISFQPLYDNQGYKIITYNGVSLEGDHVSLRLGLFQAFPRVSLLFRVDSEHLCLKIMDLKEDDEKGTRMPLVSCVRIEVLEGISVSVLAFHPSHANQIFLLCDRNIYQYDTENYKLQLLLAQIHCNYRGDMPDLRLFLLQPPFWPRFF